MTSAILTSPSVTVRAPAKVNLELRVGPPRPDGFHPLATVYQAVSLFDEVTVHAADEWSIEIGGSRALGVPADETNLALRAARLLAERHGVDGAVAIFIDKKIPVAGGMGGGSADAAATLVACDWLWDLGLSKEDLADVAAELGSDVPFLLFGGTALGTGRGEVITPVLTRGTYHWVFAPSDIGLSTPDVYRQFDEHNDAVGFAPAEPMSSSTLMAALMSGDPERLAPVLQNDLEGPAIDLRPELEEIIVEGRQLGALAGIVSGSGPTVAFLAAAHESAIDLAVGLTATGVVSDTYRATGPVAGAIRSVPRVD